MREPQVITFDGVPLTDAAETFGTPVYVYSYSAIMERLELLRSVFAPVNAHISYAMKANSNIHLLGLLEKAGIGADAVSLGEIMAAQRAGFAPRRIIFNGNGKTAEELDYAFDQELFAVNVDSWQEFQSLAAIAAARPDRRASLFLRLNPDIDPLTHPYVSTGLRTSKFGMDFETGRQVIAAAENIANLDIAGIHMHIGSQLLDASPYAAAIEKLKLFYDHYPQKALPWLNIGGGWGLDYRKTGTGFPVDWYRGTIVPLLKDTGRKIIIEPGRFLLGEAGVLLGRVILCKQNGEKRFTVTDVGMNDLARPSLYVAYHHIEPVISIPGRAPVVSDIVGPVCETGDRIAENYRMQELRAGDLFAVRDTGAYGYAMAGNYNLRPRPAEVLLRDGKMLLIRPRETLDNLLDYQRRRPPG